MSSKVYRKYFGPADFRMMHEILARAGYIISETTISRSVPLNAAKRLVKYFKATCSNARLLPKQSKHQDGSAPKPQLDDISSWENEGGAIRTDTSPPKEMGLWLLGQKLHD